MEANRNCVAIFDGPAKDGFMAGASIDGLYPHIKCDWREPRQFSELKVGKPWKVQIIKVVGKTAFCRLVQPEFELPPSVKAFMAFADQGHPALAGVPARLKPWLLNVRKDEGIAKKLQRVLDPHMRGDEILIWNAVDALKQFAKGRQ